MIRFLLAALWAGILDFVYGLGLVHAWTPTEAAFDQLGLASPYTVAALVPFGLLLHENLQRRGPLGALPWTVLALVIGAASLSPALVIGPERLHTLSDLSEAGRVLVCALPAVAASVTLVVGVLREPRRRDQPTSGTATTAQVALLGLVLAAWAAPRLSANVRDQAIRARVLMQADESPGSFNARLLSEWKDGGVAEALDGYRWASWSPLVSVGCRRAVIVSMVANAALAAGEGGLAAQQLEACVSERCELGAAIAEDDAFVLSARCSDRLTRLRALEERAGAPLHSLRVNAFLPFMEGYSPTLFVTGSRLTLEVRPGQVGRHPADEEGWRALSGALAEVAKELTAINDGSDAEPSWRLGLYLAPELAAEERDAVMRRLERAGLAAPTLMGGAGQSAGQHK